MEETRIEVAAGPEAAFPVAVVQQMTPAEFQRRFPAFAALSAEGRSLLDGAQRIRLVQVVGDRVTVYRTQTLASGLEDALQRDPGVATLRDRLVTRGIPVSGGPLTAPGVVVVHDLIFVPPETRLPVVEASLDTLPTAAQLYLVAITGDRRFADLPAAQIVVFKGGLEEALYIAAFM